MYYYDKFKELNTGPGTRVVRDPRSESVYEVKIPDQLKEAKQRQEITKNIHKINKKREMKTINVTKWPQTVDMRDSEIKLDTEWFQSDRKWRKIDRKNKKWPLTHEKLQLHFKAK